MERIMYLEGWYLLLFVQLLNKDVSNKDNLSSTLIDGSVFWEVLLGGDRGNIVQEEEEEEEGS